jgi:putative membrane protein
MIILSNVVVLLIAAIHLYILILEMFLWQKPTGRRVFATTAEFAAATRILAANQGLYNGFLAAGLAWGVWCDDPAVQVFFLGCVLVAGVFGGLTASRKILRVQALPALIALLIVVWAH